MSGKPQAVLEWFLRAFSRLDLDAMIDCLRHDATAYFPVEHQHTRLEGKRAIGNAFAAVIARVRATGAIRLPLDAEDVVWQEWGDTAIATFHLHGGHLSRRTLIFQHQALGWKIVHLHASNAPLDESLEGSGGNGK